MYNITPDRMLIGLQTQPTRSFNSKCVLKGKYVQNAGSFLGIFCWWKLLVTRRYFVKMNYDFFGLII